MDIALVALVAGHSKPEAHTPASDSLENVGVDVDIWCPSEQSAIATLKALCVVEADSFFGCEKRKARELKLASYLCEGNEACQRSTSYLCEGNESLPEESRLTYPFVPVFMQLGTSFGEGGQDCKVHSRGLHRRRDSL
eukprot:1152043-Pelagomonas_calceolata.AAC.2